MPLYPQRTRAALAIRAMLQSADNTQRAAVAQWGECYQMRPEEYTETVTSTRPKMVDGIPVDPPETEEYTTEIPRIRHVPDLPAIQQFFDDSEDCFPGGGFALCLGLASFGVAANYVHALELNNGMLPPDLQQAAEIYFGSAIMFREALKAAGVPEWVPLTPPVTLTPGPEGITVSPVQAQPQG